MALELKHHPSCTLCLGTRVAAINIPLKKILFCVNGLCGACPCGEGYLTAPSSNMVVCSSCGSAFNIWAFGKYVVENLGPNMEEDSPEFKAVCSNMGMSQGAYLPFNTMYNMAKQRGIVMPLRNTLIGSITCTAVDTSNYTIENQSFRWIDEKCKTCKGSGVKGWPNIDNGLQACQNCYNHGHLGKSHTTYVLRNEKKEDIGKVCFACEKKFLHAKVFEDIIKKAKRLKEAPIKGNPCQKTCAKCQGFGFLVGVGGALVDCDETDCNLCPFCEHKQFVPWVNTAATLVGKRCRNCHQRWDNAGERESLNKVLAQLTGSRRRETSKFRTQKAQGVAAIQNHDYDMFTPIQNIVLASALETFLFNQYWEKTGAVPHIVGGANGLFARPCPARPRHGFVESRIVHKPADIDQVWKEATASDPEAELILMSFIKASKSAILVPESGYMAVGPGHDGATGGKKSMVIPVVAMGKNHNRIAAIRENSKIKKDEDTYIEAVIESDEETVSYSTPAARTFLVQARSGPHIQTGFNAPNFIPYEMKVKEIIEPTDDLLAWEKLTHEYKDKKGVVAWRAGATLACHSAVHCVMNNIPFITDEVKPKIGSIILPPEGGATMVKMDWNRARGAFKYATTKKIDCAYSNLLAALAILHNTAALKTHTQWPEMFGWAIGTYFYYGALACIGESRHKTNITKEGSKISRFDTWVAYQELDVQALLERTRNNIAMFLDVSWGEGRCSYGGPNWANCAALVVSTYNAFLAEDEATAITELNKLVNACHNGGPLFNKFHLSQSIFACAVENPAMFMLNNVYLVDELIRQAKMEPQPLEYLPHLESIDVEKLEMIPVSKTQVKVAIPVVFDSKDKALTNKITTRAIVLDESNTETQLIKAYLQ